MLDWLGKMLQLPEDFLAGTEGQGGGVIQVSRHWLFSLFHICLMSKGGCTIQVKALYMSCSDSGTINSLTTGSVLLLVLFCYWFCSATGSVLLLVLFAC